MVMLSPITRDSPILLSEGFNQPQLVSCSDKPIIAQDFDGFAFGSRLTRRSGPCFIRLRSCGDIFALPKPDSAAVVSLHPPTKATAIKNKTIRKRIPSPSPKINFKVIFAIGHSLFCVSRFGRIRKKHSPIAPAKIDTSARLNANGLSNPQHDIFRKSATAP